MRPDRIVVGECRGGEALDMLQAMNTGHDGSMTTVHANSPRDALSRIETLTLMAGFDLPIRAIREQVAAAVDLIVQLSRLRDGSRRVTHITEVDGMEGDKITLQDIFLFDFRAGVDDERPAPGRARADRGAPRLRGEARGHRRRARRPTSSRRRARARCETAWRSCDERSPTTRWSGRADAGRRGSGSASWSRRVLAHGRRPRRRAALRTSARARPDRRAKRLDEAVAASPALRRAVEVTADLAAAPRCARLGGAVAAGRRRARCGPAELILAHVCAAVVVPIARRSSLTGSPTHVVLASWLLGRRPTARRCVASSRKRRKRFAAQLPDALTTLAGSLRAGRSLGQAMEASRRELPDPMGRELRKVVAEVRLGRTLHEALADAADRIASEDFRWAVLAMQIQAEVGGNLAELLDQVAATMRERSRMKGEVKALTAEGRASALMLVIMVPGLGLAMWAHEPGVHGARSSRATRDGIERICPGSPSSRRRAAGSRVTVYARTENIRVSIRARTAPPL